MLLVKHTLSRRGASCQATLPWLSMQGAPGAEVGLSLLGVFMLSSAENTVHKEKRYLTV